MDQAVESARRPADLASDAAGNFVQIVPQMRLQAFSEISRHVIQSLADDATPKSEKGGGVITALDDGLIRLPHQQQGAVRLNRASEMDRLSFAIRKVCLSEGGRRVRTVGQIKPPQIAIN
jgi:hypothetical protein